MDSELSQRPRAFVWSPGQVIVRDALEDAPRRLCFLFELLQHAVD